MPHPGRPKGRMNKKTQAAQAMQQEALARQQAAQMQAVQANRAAQHHQSHGRHDPTTIKEEAGIQLHDEADLITYRNDALIRYMSNHEYIENVTAKPIHSSKIVPPSLYPTLPKRKVEDYPNVNPEEIYYGDLQYMKYFDEQLSKSLKIMHQEDDPGYVRYLFNTDNYPYRRAKFAELEKLQQELNDKESVTRLETEYDTILRECREKHHQEYRFQSSTRVYSIPFKKLAPETEVQCAPDGYDPRDSDPVVQHQPPKHQPQQKIISSVANNEQDNAPPVDNNDFNSNDMFQFVNDDNDNFGGISSSIMNGNNVTLNAQQQPQPQMQQPLQQQQQQQQRQQQASALKQQGEQNPTAQFNQESMTTGSNSNNENIRLDTNGLTTDEQPPQSQQSPEAQQMNQADNGDDDDQLNNAMVAEINDLFNDNDHDMDHLAIVNDDIGDLYNFDQGDNGDLLGGSEFEQDFLSQIDQSMD